MSKRNVQRSNSPLPFFAFLFAVILVLTVLRILHTEQQKQNSATAPATTTAEDPVAPDHLTFGGEPRAASPDVSFTILKNIAYEVGYSEQRKDPLWSAYHVIRMANPFILDRPKGNFLTDDRTLAKVTHHDFDRTGYDRGHMTPNSAIARCFGADAQKETFLLSNICPQAPNLNQKVWEKLEKAELDYADSYEEIWVVDGPIFGDLNGGETRRLAAGIAVPTAFYKIIMEDQKNTPRVFAVIMPQSVRGAELPQQFATSIQNIETQTHMQFLWKLDPATREKLVDTTWPMW